MTLNLDTKQAEQTILALLARARATGQGTEAYTVCMDAAGVIQRRMAAEAPAAKNGKPAGHASGSEY